MQRAVARLRDRAAACADARRELRRLLPECARRARALALSREDEHAVFSAWPRSSKTALDDTWCAVDVASFALMAHADARVLGTPRAAAQLAADLGSLLSAVAPAPQNVARLFGVDEEEEPVAVMPPLDLGPARASSSLASILASARDSGPEDARRLAAALEGVPRRRMRRRRLGPPPTLGGSSYAAALSAARRAVRAPPTACLLYTSPSPRDRG